jgi:succinoglycan biosynthesis transport protein ExoP
MELRDYMRILRKRWLIIVLFTLVGVGAAAAVSLLAQPTYRASSLVYVAVQSSGEVTELAQGGNFAQTQVKTFAEVVAQPIVLEPVVEDYGLSESAMDLGESVSASAPLDTSNIEITVERNSAVEAADLANAITASFQEVVAEITEPTTGEPSPITVSVLRPATLPEEPASPNLRLSLALGLLVGLGLGLGLAVLREVLDTRIHNSRDVEMVTDTPIIGGISLDGEAPKRPLVVHADPRSPRAESFRTLRTNLQFLDIEGGPRAFVVTSSVQGEGKSTTAANLAIALADTDARVLIIDADLRRSKLADYMGIEGAVGLSDTLIGRTTLADAIQPWGRGNLNILPAGSIPPNPSELLGSQAMTDLLHEVESTFDAVIIDAPPLLPVTDAAVLAKRTRGALLVVAANRTQRGELAAAIGTLNTVGAHIAGVVLTMLPTKGPDSYRYGGYGYGYKEPAIKGARKREHSASR